MNETAMLTFTPMFAALSGIDQFVVSFQSIVYEALPFVIIGALISGILEELLPQQLWVERPGFPNCELDRCGIPDNVRVLQS